MLFGGEFMFPSVPPARVSRQPDGMAGEIQPGTMKSWGWNVAFGWWEDGGSVFKSRRAGKE